MAQPANQFDLFPGARYWRAVQTSVDAILGPLGINRPVQSVGSDFLNVDAWTGEKFALLLCAFFSHNPKRLPDRTEIKRILREVNATRCAFPFIQVAQLPARVSPRVAHAIIGGGFHEAFHTKYSKRGVVRIREIEPILRLAQDVTSTGGAFDAKMRGLLMTFHHLVEDVRIERRGNEDFPGAIQPMRDLQDFILDQEKEYRSESCQEKNVTVSSNARSILLCAFRDLGLGYSTGRSREALAGYNKLTPETCDFLKPGGLLKPMLEEAKQLSKTDNLGSLRVAMKIVVALWRVQQQKSSPGDQMQCPSCGATPKDLIIRSVKNKDGVKVKGRAEMECKRCGFKHEFDLPDNSLNLNQQEPEEEPDERPEVEDLTADDVGEGSDGFGDDTRERARDAQQNQTDDAPPNGDGDLGDETPSDEKGDGDGDDPQPNGDKGSGDDAPSDEGDDDPQKGGGSSGEGEDEDAPDPSSGDGDEGDLGDDDSDEGGPGDGDEEDQGNWEMSGKEFESAMSGAGGPPVDTGSLFEPMLKPVQDILDGDEKKDGVLDNRSALEAVVEKEIEAEIKAQEANQEAGERRWCPLSTSLDVAMMVPTGAKGQEELAFKMLEEVRNSGASLQARLRVVVKAQEMTGTIHGVPRGDCLSDEMLVETAIELMTNVDPQRAYEVTSLKRDTSFSMAVCLDQSSSVKGILYELSQVMMVLADSVESIRGETFVFGFRNGVVPKNVPSDWQKNHHRAHGIRYDIFKTWGETFVNTKARFANTRAVGTTPMSDGVQFGLMALNPRNAAHRVLVVITDGRPDGGHTPVIRRQIRLAREAGIQVVGVGIGPKAVFVRQLFGIPNAVWAPTVNEMPTELLMKLNELCDFTGRFRGRRAELDGDGIMPQVW